MNHRRARRQRSLTTTRSVRFAISCSISSYNRDARTETLGDCRRSIKSPRRSIRNCLPHLLDLHQYNAMTPDRFLLATSFTSQGKTQWPILTNPSPDLIRRSRTGRWRTKQENSTSLRTALSLLATSSRSSESSLLYWSYYLSCSWERWWAVSDLLDLSRSSLSWGNASSQRFIWASLGLFFGRSGSSPRSTAKNRNDSA